MQQKVVHAGVAASSFAKGAELLDHLADLPIPPKQVERLTRTIGCERVAQRDGRRRRLRGPALWCRSSTPRRRRAPELAVVQVDGGRLQIRERDGLSTSADTTAAGTEEDFDETQKGKGFRREDNLGVLLEMQSAVSVVDPCPEIPPGFIDLLRIPLLAKQIGKTAAPPDGDAAEGPGQRATDEPDGHEPAYARPR
ncbi:MAG: hypothetical protein U0736_27585 [Gemmataceae bacterium]